MPTVTQDVGCSSLEFEVTRRVGGGETCQGSEVGARTKDDRCERKRQTSLDSMAGNHPCVVRMSSRMTH